MRFEVVVVTSDEEYLHSFNAYLHQSDAAKTISLHCFSVLDHFQQWCRRGQADIVLIEEAWYQDISKTQSIPVERICLLSEQALNADLKRSRSMEEEEDLRFIFKYQSAAKTINALLSFVRSDEVRLTPSDRHLGGASLVLAITSTISGCGKTTLTLNVLKELADRSFQVLYIGLEAIGSLDCFYPIQRQGEFSTLLYYLQNKPTDVISILERSLQYEEQLGIYYIPPFEQLSDIHDIRKEDMITLIEQIKQMARFDYIVLDLDSVVACRTEGGLLGADRVWWLITDELHCVHKTKKLRQLWSFLHEMKIYDKTQYILYRKYGPTANRIEEELGKIASTMPYIPEWKQLHHSSSLMNSALYNEHVRQLIDSLLLIKEGGYESDGSHQTV